MERDAVDACWQRSQRYQRSSFRGIYGQSELGRRGWKCGISMERSRAFRIDCCFASAIPAKLDGDHREAGAVQESVLDETGWCDQIFLDCARAMRWSLLLARFPLMCSFRKAKLQLSGACLAGMK